jgi:pyrroline-5-carboxylate reductase
MKIAFMGGGNMGSAIVSGLVAHGFPGSNLMVCDPNADKREALETRCGVCTHEAAGSWLSEADLVVLAVKPQMLKDCCEEIRPLLKSSAGILSIAAGVAIESLAAWLGTRDIVRAMPNTPAKVGSGFTGLFAGAGAAEQTRQAAERIMASVGRVLWLDSEEDIHLVTGGPGSGPAYVFLFLESLAEALEKRGMSRDFARELALSTVEGAACLARETGEDFAQLRRNVTSKGGTTAKALEVFEKRDARGMMDEAVGACIARSREMAELFK